MRTWFERAAVFALSLVLSMTALTADAAAWEKEQQALNKVRDQDETTLLPVELVLPGITKVVEGKDAPKEMFTFVLRGKNGAPMPKKASGSRYAVNLTGKGQVSLGSITFDEAGTYVYTIYEVDDGELGWTYDDAEYTLTVTVEKETDSNALKCDYTIRKNGKSAKKIVFTNTYEKIDLNAKVTISGQKTWIHGTNPEENRPEEIIVVIFADGTLLQQKKVTEKSDWKYSFTLPQYTADGEEIRYTVDEADVTDYSKKISGYDITNTYVGTNTPVQPSNPTDPSSPDSDTMKPTTPTKPPKTGDEFPLTLWLVLGGVSLCGFILMLWLLARNPVYQGRHLKKGGKRLMKKRG